MPLMQPKLRDNLLELAGGDSKIAMLALIQDIAVHGSNQVADEIVRAGTQPMHRVEVISAGFRFSLRAWLASQKLARAPFNQTELADDITAGKHVFLPLLQVRPGYWAETVSLLLAVEVLYLNLLDALAASELDVIKKETGLQKMMENMQDFVQWAGDIYEDQFNLNSNVDIALQYVRPLRLGALPVLYNIWNELLDESLNILEPVMNQAHQDGVTGLSFAEFKQKMETDIDNAFSKGMFYLRNMPVKS